MDETGKQVRLMLEGTDGLLPFLWTQSLLTHLLDRSHGVLEEGVLGLIDCAKAALTHSPQDAIPLFEQMIGDQQAGGCCAGWTSTNRTKFALRTENGPTASAKLGRRWDKHREVPPH